jgi:hypothetical protein
MHFIPYSLASSLVLPFLLIVRKKKEGKTGKRGGKEKGEGQSEG